MDSTNFPGYGSTLPTGNSVSEALTATSLVTSTSMNSSRHSLLLDIDYLTQPLACFSRSTINKVFGVGEARIQARLGPGMINDTHVPMSGLDTALLRVVKIF